MSKIFSRSFKDAMLNPSPEVQRRKAEARAKAVAERLENEAKAKAEAERLEAIAKAKELAKIRKDEARAKAIENRKAKATAAYEARVKRREAKAEAERKAEEEYWTEMRKEYEEEMACKQQEKEDDDYPDHNTDESDYLNDRPPSYLSEGARQAWIKYQCDREDGYCESDYDGYSSEESDPDYAHEQRTRGMW